MTFSDLEGHALSASLLPFKCDF